MAPIIIHLNSTTATLSVFWSPPTTDSELVSTYEVTWKVKGASIGPSAHLDNSKSRYTVPSGLMSGQIYIVNVISHVNLTNPEQTIVVTSAESEERLSMKYIVYHGLIIVKSVTLFRVYLLIYMF